MLKTYLKRLFEHKSLKKVLGGNLALMVVLGSFMPASVTPTQAETTVITEASAPITTEKTLQYPVSGYTLTQSYSLFHPGIDLAVPIGTSVYPIKNGVVLDITHSRFDYGNAVLIDHGNDTMSLYAHLSKILVKKGDSVTTLDKIGLSGSTGRSTGPHLHLEIRIHGLAVNPFAVLPSPASVIY